jgi:hypothetical protein
MPPDAGAADPEADDSGGGLAAGGVVAAIDAIGSGLAELEGSLAGAPQAASRPARVAAVSRRAYRFMDGLRAARARACIGLA